MYKENNVERQLAHQRTTQMKREESKRPIKKGESMTTFVKTSSRPTNGENANKNIKQKKKTGDSPSKKEKKRSVPSMIMMFKGYLMSLWLQNPSPF